MGWSQAAILLTLLFAVVSTQRGGRRYIPDQPLEESLSVDNHRFRSRSREDVSGETRRGENRRTSAESSIESNPRLTRTRVRSDEPRQFHSSPGREVTDERQQIHSRRTHEPEKRKFTSREEVQSNRFKSRETVSTSEASPSRTQNLGRGRSRTESKEADNSRKGTRFPSRDTDNLSNINEPVRSRVGESRKGRIDSSVRGTSSRRGVQADTKSHSRNVQSQSSAARVPTRGSSIVEQITPKYENTLEKTVEPNVSTDTTGSPDLPTKINGIPESTQELITGDIDTKLSDASVSINTNGELTDNISTEEKLPGIEDSKTLFKSATISTENSLDYPIKLNDVEESQRASRKLDIDTTESLQYIRGRTRNSDENSKRRISDSSFRSRGESTEANTRSKGHHSKTRGSEEAQRGHSNTGSIRGSRIEQVGRNRGLEDSNRSHSAEDKSRTSSDFTRNSRFENTDRVRSTDDLSRSRNLKEKRPETHSRNPNTVEGRSRSQEENHDRNQLEHRGRSRNIEGRSRSNSGEQKTEENILNHSGRNRYESINTRVRTQDSTKDSEIPKRSFKYSAKIPSAPEQPPHEEMRSKSKLPTRSRSKDLANFRSRIKQTEGTPVAKITTEGKFPESVPLLEPTVETQTEAKLQTNLIEAKNEVTLGEPTEGTITTSLRPLARSLNRQPINRARGTAKGPKLLEDKDNSGEVRDDDNYPEVYKQLKKSGTDPKEILALLKARKAERDKLESSKNKITQPDASLKKTSQRGLNVNSEEIKSFRAKSVNTPQTKSNLPSRKHETEDDENQRTKSKKSFAKNAEGSELKSRTSILEPRKQTRFRSGSRSRTTVKSEEETEEKSNNEFKSKERKYSSVKRYNQQSLNEKKSLTVTTESNVQSDLPYKENQNDDEEFLHKNNENEKDEKQKFSYQGVNKFKSNYRKKEFTTESPTAEAPREKVKEKQLYIPRNRDRDYEKFKARTEKTVDTVSVETPIKPKYSIYTRNEGSTFRRRSFTTPTSEGEDLTTSKELKNSLASPRNRPTYVPPKKTYAKQTTTPLPLSRYRARKASLSKLITEDDLKVDDEEDLKQRFNGLSIDSLVSESEHASLTTEPSSVIQSTTRKRPKYTESFIQRIPPKRKGKYTRPTYRSTTSETTTTPTTTELSSTTSEVEISSEYDSLESDDFTKTTEYTILTEEFTPSMTTREVTTVETTSTTTALPTTTTTTKPSTTTKKVTTTTKRKTTKHTTPKPKTRPTTKKVTTTTTTTTTTKPTTTTTKPTTTTTVPTTSTITTSPTTTTTVPTTITTMATTTTAVPTTTSATTTTTTTTTTKKPTTTKRLTTTKKPTQKPTTKPTTKRTTTKKPTKAPITTRATTKPTTSSPKTTAKTTPTTPRTTTLKIDTVISTTHPTFLSTIAFLAKNLSVTPYVPVNTADFRTTTQLTPSTTPLSTGDNYVVYGLLPNNNVVRKVVKTTKAPVDLPFIIYGLYPNGTIVRRFPNGTIIPEETEEENEVIGKVEPGSHEELENVVKKDSPLSYLYPQGMEKPPTTTTAQAYSTTEQTSSRIIEPRLSPTVTTQVPKTTKQATVKTSTTSKPTTKATPKPTTKLSTVKPTTKVASKTTTKATTTTKPTTKAKTNKPSTTKATTPKHSTTTTAKLTAKPSTKTTAKPSTKGTTKPSTKGTTKPSTTVTSKPTTKTTSTKSSKASTTIKPTTKATTSKTTLKSANPSSTTQETNKKQSSKAEINSLPPKTSIKQTNDKSNRITTKATTPLSDLELLSNLLSQGSDNKGTTESSDVLANKVIQLAIERAQKSTISPISKGVSSSDLQSLSSTSSPVIKEKGVSKNESNEAGNKSGKISVWVIPPDESSIEKPASGSKVSQQEADILSSLISTPGALESLPLSDQLLLADVLSSTAFPQTTTKKKKKKKPKTTTTTTTQSPFPILQYIFGRNRGGGGLFQRGLFRGGGLGLTALQAGSSPQVQGNAGGIFQTPDIEPTLQQTPSEVAEPSQDDPQQGPALVNAAINVSRAVSQFMGFVIQGAAQSFQNYLQTRTRALAEALAYPPAS